jgi:hypothetical protein
LGEGIELGRRKLTGLANKELAEAAKNFAEAEDRKIDAELKRRALESKVRSEEADTRLKELEVLEAELSLAKKLKAEGVVLHRDQDGTLTLLPSGLSLPPKASGGSLARRGGDPFDE